MLSPNNKIQVFIMSYNRLHFIKETLASVVAQDYANLEIIVSDNSTNDEVKAYCASNYSDITYRFRIPHLSSHDHFNTILAEANAPAFMIFHDDDLMFPGCVSALAGSLFSDPSLSAVCGNGYFLKGEKKTRSLVNKRLSKSVVLSNPLDFLVNYLAIASGNQPFPGYLYRTQAVRGLRTSPMEGGKYSDLTFLLKVLERGKVFWKNVPLIYYRVHPGNDSAYRDPRALLKLLRYLKLHYGLKRRSFLAECYMAKNYVLCIGSKQGFSFLKRRPFLFKSFIKRYFFFMICHPRSLFLLVRQLIKKVI